MFGRPVSLITSVLTILILVSFAIGVYQINRQAQQIAQITEAQSPLVFAFENAMQSQVIVVSCIRKEIGGRYTCISEQYDRAGRLIVTGTPITAPETTPTPVNER